MQEMFEEMLDDMQKSFLCLEGTSSHKLEAEGGLGS